MIIQNFKELATTEKKRECLEILEAGLGAADPEKIIPRFVNGGIRVGGRTVGTGCYSAVYTVAFGKAADTMTRAFNAAIPVKGGIVVIPKGSRSRVRGKKFHIFNSGHPRPDQASVKAAKEVAKFVQNRRDGELVVFLISGGGSSLLAMPDGITLADKVRVTDLLLRSGATVQESNCVRKHLSRIKGGRLVRGMKCQGVGLVMSDVEGDDLSSIASGPTCADETTYADALGVIEKYDLERKTPPEVLQVLEGGLQREDKGAGPGIENRIIANNYGCLEEMQRAARKMGYGTDVIQVFGDIREAVTKILDSIPGDQKTCLIFGGEPTVRVLGRGTGGRNQEMVLRLLKNTQKLGKITIASMGTDGIDGNSVFAGAITENVRMDTGMMREFLRNSDSGRFFQKQKANIVTGFTHTNLMDIGVILR